MTAASIIITQAQDILNDAGVRWPTTELLRWINAGQQAIVVLRPDANALGQNITLSAGTRQQLPAGGLLLLDISRNMGADGNTPGKPIRLVQREMLDINPGWHTDAASSYITNYCYDERIPKEFWVYPPANNGIRVWSVVSMTPNTVDEATDTLDIGVMFEGALLDYVLFRGFMKGATVGNQQRALTHFKTFSMALGAEAQAKVMNSPNSFNLDGIPPRAGGA